MRAILFLPLAAALILPACKKADEPKTAKEVQGEVAQMVKPRPGQYRSSIKLIDFQVPGMPAAQAEQMKTMFATRMSANKFCLTQAEADKGYEEFTKRLGQGKCTYDRFDADGGKLDAKMTCETMKNAKATIEMNGTMTSEGSHMTMSVDQTAPGTPMAGMKMRAEVTSERIGDCT